MEGILKKNSYERRDYESVNEKSLSWAMSRKTTKKKSGHEWVNKSKMIVNVSIRIHGFSTMPAYMNVYNKSYCSYLAIPKS